MTSPIPPGGTAGSRFNLSEWALTHRSLVLYLILIFAVAGALAYQRLGQSEDPPFTFRVMVVKTNWPGATAHEVEQQVTDRIERKLQEVPLVDWVRSYSKPGESLVFFALKDSAPPGSAAGRVLPGAQEDRRRAEPAPRRHPGAVLQRRVRRHLHEHLRADGRRLRLPAAEGVRRPCPGRAAARAGRGQGRLHRRAGREDLHRAREQQARDARRRAGADHRDAREAERRRGGRRVRHGDRPHLRAADRRVRQRRRDPRHLHPREQPHLPAG